MMRRILQIAVFAAATVWALGADAQIAFRAAASAAIARGEMVITSGALAERADCGSITPAISAGSVGDLLIAQVVARRNAATVTMTGWNTLYTDNVAGENYQVFLFYRSATSAAANGDPRTITQSGTCNQFMARITRFENVDEVQPLEFAAGEPPLTGNSAYVDGGSVSTGTQIVNVANSVLVAATFVADDRTVTQSGTFTQLYDDADNSGDDAGMSLNYRIETTTGTKGAFTAWDLSGTGNTPNHGVLFAVRPSPGLRINVPTGTVANDVMIAGVTVRPCSNTDGGNCTVTVTTPAGWTAITTVDQEGGAGTDGWGNRLFSYRRVATGSEPASYTWVIGGTPIHAGAAGGILSFSGVDTTNPIVVSGGQATNVSNNHDAPSINTGTVTNTMLVSTHTINSSASWTPPSGMTEVVDVNSLTANDELGLTIELNYEARAAAGATGIRRAVFPGAVVANDTGATHMLALRPIQFTHYAISGTTGGLTCEPTQITITAHNASDAAATPPAGTTLTITTSTGTGVWETPLVSGSGTWTVSGANNGQATYVWPGGESNFVASLRHTTAIASLSVNLTDGTRTELAAEDPTFAFTNTGFRVTADGTATTTIGTQISGKDSNTGFGAQTLYWQAVRTDTNTGSCTTVFQNQTVTIQMASECNSPTACVAGSLVSLRNSAATMQTIAQNNSGSVASFTNISLAFDAQSKAPLVVRYPDAGQITLHARYQLPSPPTSIFMSGSSNAFVVRPFGLAFRGATASAAAQHGTSATSGVLAPAGDNFTMTVAAYQWASGEDTNVDGVPDAGVDITNNGLTPNFAWSTAIAPTVNLPGVALGTMTLAHADTTRDSTIRQAEWSGAAATFNTWRYSEVGNVFLSATASNYISAGITVSGGSGFDGTGAAGGYVGRFRPKHFRVDGGTPATLANRALLLPCASAFSYMGEAMRLTFRLLAQNTQNVTTQNYTGAYAKHDPNPASPGTPKTAFDLAARGGATNLTGRVTAVYAGLSPAWANGVLDIPTANPLRVSIERATPDNPDGPYTGVQFGIAPVDSDGVAMASYDQDVDGVGGSDHTAVAGTTEVRFGRLRILSAVGSERLPLPVPMQIEYWSGSGFVVNTLDSCTTLAQQNITMSSYQLNLPACETAFPNATTVTFASGAAIMTLAAPGDGNNGSVDLRVNLGTASGQYCSAQGAGEAAAASASRSYLQGRWTGSNYAEDPMARAAFGVYGAAPNRLIYLRENY